MSTVALETTVSVPYLGPVQKPAVRSQPCEASRVKPIVQERYMICVCEDVWFKAATASPHRIAALSQERIACNWTRPLALPSSLHLSIQRWIDAFLLTLLQLLWRQSANVMGSDRS